MEKKKGKTSAPKNTRQPRRGTGEEFYVAAAEVVGAARAKQSSIKTLCYSHAYANKAKLYALACESLRYYDELISIYRSGVSTLHLPNLKSEALAAVALHDLLLGRGLQCGGKLKGCLAPHKAALKAELHARIRAKGGTSAKDLLSTDKQSDIVFPRYARVNTLRASTGEVLAQLQHDDGYRLAAAESAPSMPDPKTVWCDPHVPDLLVLPPSTDLHAHKLYTSGTTILQDKSSCFPALCLAPAPGSIVIDACAAPGNKTSHLSALMHNRGRVFAFELNARRLATMQTMLTRAGATCVEARCADFLEVDANAPEFANVEYALVDPSCSGSGIVDRRDVLVGKEESSERLASLAEFQRKCVLHAMSFPCVKRVVYSTCSVHKEENEEVVAAVLDARPDFHLVQALPSWPRRGLPEYKNADCLVRVDPAHDLTNGFFVALFAREGDKPEGIQASAATRKRKKKNKKNKNKKTSNSAKKLRADADAST